MKKTTLSIIATVCVIGILFTGCATKTQAEKDREILKLNQQWTKRLTDDYNKKKAYQQVYQKSYNKAYYGY